MVLRRGWGPLRKKGRERMGDLETVGSGGGEDSGRLRPDAAFRIRKV